MTGERWAELKPIFQDALQRDGADRAAALERACGPDADLRRDVERLLAAHAGAGSFLEPRNGVAADGLSIALGDVRGEPVPAHVGPYRVIRELGRGGMGTVYLAERDDPNLRRTVALKLVDVGSRSLVRRFQTETQILAALEHPGIARLYDGGTAPNGLPYFAMEYVAGTDLLTYCNERRASIADRVARFARVCDAVQYAHQNLVVHRDLKPSNILVTADGDPKLLDFGIAKLVTPDGDTADETVWFARVLTPQYASPEHLRGDPVTPASDVYSLGVILYELLCGCRPYRVSGRSHAEIERAIAHHEIVPPSKTALDAAAAAARATNVEKLRRRLRGDLDTIALKALSAAAAHRYATAADLAADLRRHVDGFPVEARPDSSAYRVVKFVRRHRAAVATGGLTAVSLVVGLTAALWQAHIARSEAAKAQQMAAFLSGMFQNANPVEARGKPLMARDLLDRGTASINGGLKNSPEVQASLLLVMADAYFRLDVIPKSVELAQQALGIRERRFGADSPEVADALYTAGIMLRRAGRGKDGLPLLERALAIRQKRRGADDPALAQTMASVALAREGLGISRGVRELFEKSVAIEERTSPRTSRLALAYNNLATHLHRHGDLAAARRAYERSIANYETSQEAENWGIAMPLLNLGTLLREDEELPAAQPLFERALAIDEQRFGAESQGTAYTLGCLGDLARARGDFARAHQLLERSVATFTKSDGPDTRMIAAPERYLGLTLVDEGRAADAIPHLEHALRVEERTHGPSHQEVAGTLVELARARLVVSGPAAAEPLLRRALAIQQSVLPEDHRDRVPTLTLLAQVLVQQQRPDEARALLDEAVRLASRHLPSAHSYRVAAEAARRQLTP
jgi:serine/threonine-protein kinase